MHISINKSFKPIKLKIANNIITSNPLKIVQKFSSHLKTLYSEANTCNDTEADSFSQIQLPQMKETQKTQLEKPITQDDVAAAIKELKLNKRPGPDGFSTRYYKTFKDLISPRMAEAFNDLLK